VGIPTCNRSASLGRCLDSFQAGVERGDASPDLVIVDDSSSDEQRAATRRQLEVRPARYPGRLWYAGPEEKAHFARLLAAHAGLDPTVVEFALVNSGGFPVGTGTSRNLLLLQAAGEALLQLDDDTLCCVAPAPGARPGLVVSYRFDPTEFWFPAADEPISTDPFVALDVLTLHEQLLGKRLDEAEASHLDGVEPGSEPATRGDLNRTNRRIRVTASGVAGDSGMSSSAYFLTLAGPSRERLLRSEAHYRAAIRRHRLLRSVTRPTIGPKFVCQSLNLAIDHRQLVPPFMPVMRNQDGIFATIVSTCDHDAWFGMLPWTIRHETPHSRVFTDEDHLAAVTRLRCDQFVQLILRAAEPHGQGDLAENLAHVGRSLCAFADRPPGAFADLADAIARQQLLGLSRRLADTLDTHGHMPDWWAADVGRLRQAIDHRLTSSDVAVPEDLRRTFGRDPALATLQRLVGCFGRMLLVWPAMVEAAQDLRASGIRPANLLRGR
jgi:hypothetical protein